SFTMTTSCTGATANITGGTGGTFAFNPVPTDGAIIDPADGTVSNGTSGATYTVEYTITGDCLTTSSVTFTLETTDDSSFTMNPLCDSAEAEVTGVTGGTFAFNPVPVD